MSGRVAAVIATTLLASGCNLAFQLSTVTGDASGDAARDAAGDAAGDAGHDAGPCIGHDEDGDGIADVCDNCPTIPNPGQENIGETQAGVAADPVGDACDPHPTLPGDAILLFLPFTGPTTEFQWSGTVTFVQDAVGIAGDSSNIVTTVSYVPTTIVAAISFDSPTGQEVVLSANGNGVSCDATTSSCVGALTAGCLTAQTTSGISTPFGDAEQLAQMEIDSDAPGQLRCTAVTPVTSTQTFVPATFVDGKVAISTKLGTSVAVQNLIIYGVSP